VKPGAKSSGFFGCGRLPVVIRKNETSINCRVSTSNNGGTFAVEYLKPGTYGLFAIKQEDGYAIENQRSRQVVNMLPSSSSSSNMIIVNSLYDSKRHSLRLEHGIDQRSSAVRRKTADQEVRLRRWG
jgi:hypothetical protein